MTTPDPGDTVVDLDEQTATDVARLAQLNREIDERKATADEIKARLRELPPGRRYRFGGREVLDLGKPGTQFDAKLAAAAVPPALLTQISVPKPDPALAKRILPPDLYAACCTSKAPAVKPL